MPTLYQNFQFLKAILLAIILFCFNKTLNAQDPSFSQAYNSPLYLNPAMAGTLDGMRINLHYRNQWTYVPGTFSTSSFAIDFNEPKMNAGIGFTAMNDIAGEGSLITNKVGFIYSYGDYIVKSQDITFNLALGGNLAQKSIDWSKLEFSDQFDPVYGKRYATNAVPPVSETTTFGNIDFGSYFKGKFRGRRNRAEYVWNGGFAVHSLLGLFDREPNESLLGLYSPLPTRFTIHGGLLAPIGYFSSDKGAFAYPHLVLRKQANLEEILAAVYAFRNPLLLGIGYHSRRTPVDWKNTNAMVIYAGYQHQMKRGFGFQFMYSYDLNTSGLSFSTYGSHEASLIFFFDGACLFGSTGKNGDTKESNCLKIRRKGFIPQF